MLTDEIAMTVEFAPWGYKMTVFASGRIEGLTTLLDVAYATPREDVQVVAINYIPDLLKQHRSSREDGTFDLGFKVAQCENGAWVLAEYTLFHDEWTRYTCADDEALYVQMRAWTERQIAGHRKHRAIHAKQTAEEAPCDLSKVTAIIAGGNEWLVQ